MSDHTPEPWETQEMPSKIECRKRGDWIMLSSPDWFRARACVNACAGIPTEALEGADVKALVDALASARVQLHGYHEEAYGEDYNDPRINAALAPFLKGDTDES